jgi:predicted amidophosphoribosyltransferase
MRRRFSNSVDYNSPDGLPTSPYPKKAMPTICGECFEKVTEEVCPHCGAENDIDYEDDFEFDNLPED